MDKKSQEIYNTSKMIFRDFIREAYHQFRNVPAAIKFLAPGDFHGEAINYIDN